jgi:hypothetical protein
LKRDSHGNQARAVLDDRGDPNRGEAEGFDVVHLLDEAFEVAAPGRIVGRGGFIFIPVVHIVGGIGIIETGGDAEIDGFLPEVFRVSLV